MVKTLTHSHTFVENHGDYELLCNGVKAAFIPYLIAKNQMIRCPLCGEGANFNSMVEDVGGE